jgi:hypothetical protein
MRDSTTFGLAARQSAFPVSVDVGSVKLVGRWSCIPEPNKFVGDVAQHVGQFVRIVEFGHKPAD